MLLKSVVVSPALYSLLSEDLASVYHDKPFYCHVIILENYIVLVERSSRKFPTMGMPFILK